MPRRKSAHKTERLTSIGRVLLTADEKAQVTSKAARAGLSFSNYCRRLLLGKPVTVDAGATKQLITEVVRIGTNLNQLTRVANTTRRIPAGVDACLEAVEQILKKVLPK